MASGSTFRDRRPAEETDHPREVIEAALAQVVDNKVEAASARSDLLERRRRLMDDWEACLAGERPRVPAAHRADRTTPCRAGVGHGDRDPLHRDRVVVPRRPPPAHAVPGREVGLARTVVPSAPAAGEDQPAPNAGSAGGADAAPRPDLELRSGLHPVAVKGDGHGMGGEPLPLRRRTRPA